MKKLFLASYASVTLDLIESLLPKPASQLNAAFIPTAANPYENKDFAYADKNKLLEMGFRVIDVDIATIQHESLESILDKIDVILVAGGNTFYLLDQVKKSGFDVLLKQLLEKGVIYIGSSASAVLCGPTILSAKQFDDSSAAPDLHDYTGLNLFPNAIIPHAQKEKYALRIQETIAELTTQGYTVTTLTDAQAILVNGDAYQVVEINK